MEPITSRKPTLLPSSCVTGRKEGFFCLSSVFCVFRVRQSGSVVRDDRWQGGFRMRRAQRGAWAAGSVQTQGLDFKLSFPITGSHRESSPPALLPRVLIRRWWSVLKCRRVTRLRLRFRFLSDTDELNSFQNYYYFLFCSFSDFLLMDTFLANSHKKHTKTIGKRF